MPKYIEEERRLRREEQQERKEERDRFRELNGDEDVATRDELEQNEDMMYPNREYGDDE